MFNKFLYAAGFAAISQAFLLPPSISVDNADIIHSLPFEDAVEIDAQSLMLECQNCPVLVGSSEDGTDMWVYGLPSMLQVDFQIKHFEDADALFFSDVQLHPFDQSLSPISLRLPQIINHTTIDESTAQSVETRLTPPLGYAMSIELPSEQSDEIGLLDISIQILQIGDVFVDDIDSIELKLLQTPSGRLMIADLASAPTQAFGQLRIGQPSGQCVSLLCKTKAFISAKLSQLRPKRLGCGGIDVAQSAAREQNRPHLPTDCGPHCHPHDLHGHSHGIHGYHKHHGFSKASHILRSVTFHLLIPLFIGVVSSSHK